MGFEMEHLTGRTFGRLTVEGYIGGGLWACTCTCGGVAKVFTQNLKTGNSRSCGCLHRERRFKHGMAKTPVYHAWQSMIQRCENPKDASYHNYGARGITVCAAWHQFGAFLADMGVRPKGFQIDRIDNDKGYSPDNCRWVSAKTNHNNQRHNRIIEHNGMRLTIARWAELLGMNYRTLNNRINRGWPVERALTEPADKEIAK